MFLKRFLPIGLLCFILGIESSLIIYYKFGNPTINPIEEIHNDETYLALIAANTEGSEFDKQLAVEQAINSVMSEKIELKEYFEKNYPNLKHFILLEKDFMTVQKVIDGMSCPG